jgi:hypothetical protein
MPRGRDTRFSHPTEVQDSLLSHVLLMGLNMVATLGYGPVSSRLVSSRLVSSRLVSSRAYRASGARRAVAEPPARARARRGRDRTGLAAERAGTLEAGSPRSAPERSRHADRSSLSGVRRAVAEPGPRRARARGEAEMELGSPRSAPAGGACTCHARKGADEAERDVTVRAGSVPVVQLAACACRPRRCRRRTRSPSRPSSGYRASSRSSQRALYVLRKQAPGSPDAPARG